MFGCWVEGEVFSSRMATAAEVFARGAKVAGGGELNGWASVLMRFREEVGGRTIKIHAASSDGLVARKRTGRPKQSSGTVSLRSSVLYGRRRSCGSHRMVPGSKRDGGSILAYFFLQYENPKG